MSRLYKFPITDRVQIKKAIDQLTLQYRDTGHLDPEQEDWLDYAESILIGNHDET